MPVSKTPMRFLDFYPKGVGPRFSVEIFPPKTEAAKRDLFVELEQIKPVNPTFVSVTYGAMGSTRTLTRELVLGIREKLGLTTAFHFTCVGFDKKQIHEYVTDLLNRGVNLVVALRGDIPPEMGSRFIPPENGFHYASELVGYLKSCDGLSMAVAGYPEKHMEAESFESDLANLKRKVDAGADIVITQLFFENHHFVNYLERVRAMGVDCPVIPGILPIRNLKQLDRIVHMSGASLPAKLKSDLEKHQNDPRAVANVGREHAISQCRELIELGVHGIHVYSLNKAEPVLNLVEGCRDLLKG